MRWLKKYLYQLWRGEQHGHEGCGGECEPGVAASALGMVTTWSQQRGAEQLPQVAKSVGHSSDAKPTAAPANAEGFVGLINQGATCYLSSLLQSLYMTPEFRAMLYEWRYAGPRTVCA